MITVTSSEGALYPWSYVCAEEPKKCDGTIAQHCYVATMAWSSQLCNLTERLFKSGFTIGMGTLVHAVGVALRTLGENRVLNYRRDGIYLDNSVIILSENNIKRLFIKNNVLEGTGKHANVWRVVCIYLPSTEPQELRFDILVKISLNFKPYHDNPAQGGTPLLYRRISIIQQLALENSGVGIYATVHAATSNGTQKMYLYQERGRDLYGFFGNVARSRPIEDRLKLAVDVAAELAYLHQQGIVHNDVKPRNYIVMPDEKVKIIDFDYSRKTGDPLQSVCRIGTIVYAAPEQLDQCVDLIEVQDRDPFAWDNFSLGLTLYRILNGREHAWLDMTVQYRKLHEQLKLENFDLNSVLAQRDTLTVPRKELEQKMAKHTEEYRKHPADSYSRVVAELLDPNPDTRLKSVEAHARLAALIT